MTVFCTLADLRAVASVEPGYTGDDALLALFIEQASAQIREYTRRQFDRGQYTDYVSTTDIDRHIKRGKSTFVISLTEKNVSVAEGEYPKLRYETAGRWDNTDDLPNDVYSVDTLKSQIIIYPQILTHAARSVRIIYTAGYAPLTTEDNENVLDVPSHIKMACIAQANFLYRRHVNSLSGSSATRGQARGLEIYGVTASGLTGEALALIKSEVKLLTGS